MTFEAQVGENELFMYKQQNRSIYILCITLAGEVVPVPPSPHGLTFVFLLYYLLYIHHVLLKLNCSNPPQAIWSLTNRNISLIMFFFVCCLITL